MNRNIVVVVALLVAGYIGTAYTQSFSTANERMPMPVADAQIRSFVALATPTFTVGVVTPVQVTGLPAGTKGIYVCAGAAALNYGPSTVASAANAWPSIATTAVQHLAVSPLDPSPDIYMISQSGTQTVRITAYK
jgi:hypothetical protein